MNNELKASNKFTLNTIFLTECILGRFEGRESLPVFAVHWYHFLSTRTEPCAESGLMVYLAQDSDTVNVLNSC